jgi:hypothetical protein
MPYPAVSDVPSATSRSGVPFAPGHHVRANGQSLLAYALGAGVVEAGRDGAAVVAGGLEA